MPNPITFTFSTSKINESTLPDFDIGLCSVCGNTATSYVSKDIKINEVREYEVQLPYCQKHKRLGLISTGLFLIGSFFCCSLIGAFMMGGDAKSQLIAIIGTIVLAAAFIGSGLKLIQNAPSFTVKEDEIHLKFHSKAYAVKFAIRNGLFNKELETEKEYQYYLEKMNEREKSAQKPKPVSKKGTSGNKKIEGLVKKYRDLGSRYPELKPFTTPLAASIETGKDPEGNKTDYLEVASVTEGVVIKMAKEKGLSKAVPALQEIVKGLNALVSVEDSSSLGLAMKGQLLIDQGEFDEAINVLTKALEKGSELGDAKFNLGLAYYQKIVKEILMGSRALTPEMKQKEQEAYLKNLNMAEKCWAEVLQQEPNNKAVTEAMQNLKAFRKEHNL